MYSRCLGTLRCLLTDLSGPMVDLDVTLTRQARFTQRVGGANAGMPLPFGCEASEEAWVARQTLLAWVGRNTAIRAHRMPKRGRRSVPTSPITPWRGLLPIRMARRSSTR